MSKDELKPKMLQDLQVQEIYLAAKQMLQGDYTDYLDLRSPKYSKYSCFCTPEGIFLEREELKVFFPMTSIYRLSYKPAAKLKEPVLR